MKLLEISHSRLFFVWKIHKLADSGFQPMIKYLMKVDNMRLLESGGNGAKLYAAFENGLAYEVSQKSYQKAFK